MDFPNINLFLQLWVCAVLFVQFVQEHAYILPASSEAVGGCDVNCTSVQTPVINETVLKAEKKLVVDH